MRFLVEIFHPEVRDDKHKWRELLKRINNLLYPDGYKIVAVDKLSRRDIYGWKATKRELTHITDKEISYFESLFDSGGYVIDFQYRNQLDDFTERSVGKRLCDTYNLPAGKSLSAFFNEEDEDRVIKLIIDLWDHALEHLSSKVSQKELAEGSAIINRLKHLNPVVVEQITKLKMKFDNSYIQQQLDIMLKCQESDPTNAIGLAKELIESCCKTILDYYQTTYDKNNFNKLVGKTTETLKITPKYIPIDMAHATSMKAILGSLATIATNLAHLRNSYGRGHGKDTKYKGLSARHARLAVGASSTLVNFLWDSFERQNPMNHNSHKDTNE